MSDSASAPVPQPPSPQDNIILSHVGTVITSNIVANTCHLFFFGVFALLSAFALYFLLRKRLRSKPQKALFILTVYLILSYTSFIATTITIFIMSVDPVFQSNFDLPLVARLDIANLSVVSLVKYANWSETLNVLSGDIVVVWRAWAIWNGDNLLVNFGLIISMLANVAINLYSAATYEPLESNEQNNRFGVAAMFLSFIVNVLATSLIYLKAWRHRRVKRAALTEEKNLRKSDVDRILLLIIESGVIYCAMQLIYPVLDTKLLYTPDAVPGSPLVTAVNIFGTIYSAITVIYPMAVIILIHTRRSVIVEVTSGTVHDDSIPESDGSSRSPRRTLSSNGQRQNGILSTLRFAPSASVSTSEETTHGRIRTSGTDVEMGQNNNVHDRDEVMKSRI